MLGTYRVRTYDADVIYLVNNLYTIVAMFDALSEEIGQ